MKYSLFTIVSNQRNFPLFTLFFLLNIARCGADRRPLKSPSNRRNSSFFECMAYSPSKKPRLSISSASSTASATGPETSNQTLSRRTSWNKDSNIDSSSGSIPIAMANPLEGIFREEASSRPFKYEFPSQASLGFQDPFGTEDDETHLTGSGPARKHEFNSARSRTTLQRVSRNLRRISVRVVNLGSTSADDRHNQLADDDDEDVPQSTVPESILAPKSSLLRGTTLGFLGPDNPVRLAMYKFLMYP